MRTRQMGAIPPSAILSGKGIARGVSRTGPLSGGMVSELVSVSVRFNSLKFSF